jgi:hypothetical protein
MDVRLPDGTTVANVPDGTSRADLAQKLKANGHDVPQDWLAPTPKPQAKPEPAPTFGKRMEDIGGSAYNIARGAVMAPASDVAGLAAIPLHAAGAISTPPFDIKAKVAHAGEYTPQTETGRAIERYNPLALVGRGVNALAGGAERLVAPPKTSGPLRAALGYGVKGAIEQAPMLAGAGAGPAAEGASGALRAGAERMMHSALKPGLRFGKQAEPAIDTLLERGINVTPGGLEKLHGQIDDLNSRIGQLIANSPAMIDKPRVAARLHDTLLKFEKQVDPHADLATIQKTWDNFMNHPLLTGKKIPVKTAQQLKQGTYTQLKGKYGEQSSAETEAQKALARGLKEEIAKAVPEVSPLNAEDSKLLQALPLVERRVIVSANKNPVGLGVLSMNPKNIAVWMADRSELFKSLVARMLNAGSGAVGRMGDRGPPIGIAVQGAANQLAPPPQ